MCGIVGITAEEAVSVELFDSLIHLQHRGQDAAGIIACDGKFHIRKGKGLVREIFSEPELNQLPGRLGIAHTRYPTSGVCTDEEIQPFWISAPYGIAMAHNGNLINPDVLAKQLTHEHQIHFNTTSDSEVLLNLLAVGFMQADCKTDFFTQAQQAVKHVYDAAQGSYSVVCAIANKGLLAFRDPHGIRPLVYGKRQHDNGKVEYIVASETTMFYQLGFTEVDSVKAGEILFIDYHTNTLHKQQLTHKSFNPCIFEYIYFARPDAKLDDVSVYRSRLRMGANLAENWKKTYPNILPDIVIPAPFTSNTAALAFANHLGVRYSEGLYKNPFIGRTFIMNNNKTRQRSIRYKLVPQEFEIRDKHVLILDDSIVRGTTSKEIVSMIREFGAKSIYFATTCPPIRFPCFYGIDIPTRAELIASNKTEEEIKNYLQVDLLLYQAIEDLEEAVTRRGKHAIDTPCMACLNGQYICGNITQQKLEMFEQRRLNERLKSAEHD